MYLPATRIVEVAILHHHLRLDETGLGPRGGSVRITIPVVSDPDETFGPPVANVLQPHGMLVLGTNGGRAFPRAMNRQATGRGNLLPDRVRRSVLRDEDAAKGVTSEKGEAERATSNGHWSSSPSTRAMLPTTAVDFRTIKGTQTYLRSHKPALAFEANKGARATRESPSRNKTNIKVRYLLAFVGAEENSFQMKTPQNAETIVAP